MEIVLPDTRAGLPAGVSAQELFDASPDGLVIADRDGIVLAVNDSLLELLGYAREQVVGRSVDLLVPPAVRERHRSHRALFAAAPGPRGMGAGLDLHAARADGDLVPVDVMLGPLPSAGEGCVLAAVRDARQQRDREAAWAHRALHDPLTGLANRSLVLDRLEQAAMRAARSGGVVVVFFLDLDLFKRVNDERGHAAGDQVLVTVAQRLAAELRPSDTVGRVGGDEFVAIVEMPSGASDISVYVDRLRAAVTAPIVVGDEQMEVGCSIGWAVGDGHGPWARLLEEADARMFADKAERRVLRV